MESNEAHTNPWYGFILPREFSEWCTFIIPFFSEPAITRHCFYIRCTHAHALREIPPGLLEKSVIFAIKRSLINSARADTTEKGQRFDFLGQWVIISFDASNLFFISSSKFYFVISSSFRLFLILLWVFS